MSVLPRLLQIYADRGFQVRTGLNPAHFGGHREAPFTYLWRDGELVSGFGGISLHEVMLLEALCGALAPRHIYVIGNAWGWSSLALALSAPAAVVVAADPTEEDGARLTERIAAEEGLRLSVLRGASPAITPAAVEALGGKPLDLVLIDGDHTIATLIADFEAVLPWLGSSGVVVCHDVVQHNMLDGITTLRARHGGAGTFTVLERTASGMVVFAKPAAPPEARAVLACFHDPVAGIELG